MYVVLVYDISKDENGQKRWSHIFKICKKISISYSKLCI